MYDYIPKPHVSAALAHLRHGVTACAVLVLVCAVAQMLVFGFVHFTNVRWGTGEQEQQTQSLAVVTQAPGTTATWREVTVPSNTNKQQIQPAPVTFSRMPTTWDAGLNVVSDLAVTAGVISCIILATMAILGVVIAGGASVPGVDRVVSAATWSMLLAAGCIPWREFFSSVPFPGIFGSYSAMTTLSDAVDGGAGSALLLFTGYLLMPLCGLVCGMLILSRFRAGVEQGIIVTSVSELEERLEREMDGIRSRGVSARGSRAVGALNSAIGEKPALTLTPPEPPLAATGTTGAPAPAGRSWLSQRRVGQANPGDSLQRPI